MMCIKRKRKMREEIKGKDEEAKSVQTIFIVLVISLVQKLDHSFLATTK